MGYSATPDGKGGSLVMTRNDRIGEFPSDTPQCNRGHVIHGFHSAGNAWITCQHKTRSESCGCKCYIVPIMDRCIVLYLSNEEFELSRKTNRAGLELRRDLAALIEAFLKASLV